MGVLLIPCRLGKPLYPANLQILRCPVCSSQSALLVSPFTTAPDGEIVDALLQCPDCQRWYRLEDGIPDLVRDALREVDDDRAFLRRFQDLLPEGIHNSGVPLAATGSVPERTADDERIVEEGRHWGRFMRRFWDVGDRSIFDIRVKGTHPPYFVAGILERDDRDAWRRWSNFPNSNGDVAFSWLHQLEGKRGVDVGCGGGQFGLEAARQGINMIGTDPSFEELQLARRHARETGLACIDYVRSEPAQPPFVSGAFDLMMAKDSLHHVPDLEVVFPTLLETLKADGYFLCHEHVAHASIKARLMGLIAPRAINKIRSRYPKVDIPAELLRDSANEDVSAHAIRPVLAKYFQPIHTVETLFLANELEGLTYFAFGKRAWLAHLVYPLGQVLEFALLLLGDRQHVTYLGRRLPEKSA